MAGPIFPPPYGGRISIAKVSNDLDFGIFGTFSIISQKCINVGGKSEAKYIKKTLIQEYDLSQNFFA
jgi:hypothetical protein